MATQFPLTQSILNRPGNSAMTELRNQLFLKTADGKRLTTISGNYGIQRPIIGLGDDTLWRALTQLLQVEVKNIPNIFNWILAEFLGPHDDIQKHLAQGVSAGSLRLYFDDTSDMPRQGVVILGYGGPQPETLAYWWNDYRDNFLELVTSVSIGRTVDHDDLVFMENGGWDLIEVRPRTVIVRVDDQRLLANELRGTSYLHPIPRSELLIGQPAKVGDLSIFVKDRVTTLPPASLVNPFEIVIGYGRTAQVRSVYDVNTVTNELKFNVPLTRHVDKDEMCYVAQSADGNLTQLANAGQTTIRSDINLWPGFYYGNGVMIIDPGGPNEETVYVTDNPKRESALVADVAIGDTTFQVEPFTLPEITGEIDIRLGSENFKVRAVVGARIPGSEFELVTGAFANTYPVSRLVYFGIAANGSVFQLAAPLTKNHLFNERVIIYYGTDPREFPFVPPNDGDLPQADLSWPGPYIYDKDDYGLYNAENGGLPQFNVAVTQTDPRAYFHATKIREFFNLAVAQADAIADPIPVANIPNDTVRVPVTDASGFLPDWNVAPLVVPANWDVQYPWPVQALRISVEDEGYPGKSECFYWGADLVRNVVYISGLRRNHPGGSIVTTRNRQLLVEGSDPVAGYQGLKLLNGRAILDLGWPDQMEVLRYAEATVSGLPPGQGILKFGTFYGATKPHPKVRQDRYGQSVPAYLYRTDGVFRPSLDGYDYPAYLHGFSVLIRILSVLDKVRSAGVQIVFVDKNDREIDVSLI